MDTTEQYINMCATKEIQTLYEAKRFELSPSYIYDIKMERICVDIWLPKALAEMIQDDSTAKSENIIVSIERDKEKHKYYPADKPVEVIWLPRQDQLQAIFKIDCQIVHLKSGKIEFWYGEENHIAVESIEEGLLMAVMKEKHNKEWDGKDWKWIVK